jgi:hypothetical protein
MANNLYNKQVSPKGYKRGGLISRIRKKMPELSGKTSKKIKKFIGA